MKKLMKIPMYVPVIGLIISFVLFFIVVNSPNDALLAAGLVLVHLSAWILAAKFLLLGPGFFSMVLSDKKD
ncbi:MAG: hypothetical protein A2W91_11180 [Bacteroidetes bacterium GWF2_38_335]|nr:MAG: hypothetical protein A2W91_11180 [Bacteroidetes bacterium GWF2_38_335]OFY81740.1 MAG: hypothetical protein A2281_05860 [Bacteroidetes bacterium RIFOXYA12_FULL_38_20]HBS87805.1 hypothetical protein [Bacteroidales bacterium]